MSTTYRSLASYQFKSHLSLIQALTHTERRMSRIEMNSQFNFIFFTKKESSHFKNDDFIHEQYEIKKSKKICMIYIDDFIHKKKNFKMIYNLNNNF